MARNHIVPKLIIKRFADLINMFDTDSEYLNKERNPKKVFYKNDEYTEEVETQLSRELEAPFAKLIEDKIIGKSKIVLMSEDSALLRRFLLVQSIRTRGPDEFYKIFSDFKEAVDRCTEMHGLPANFRIMDPPSMTDKTEGKFDLYMQTIKMFIECNDADDMLYHPFVTKESYFWAKTFMDAYIVFWDSDGTEDFVLTDNGMTTEYDLSHSLLGCGYIFSKLSYLYAQYKNHKDDRQRGWYFADLILKNQTMYENFNIFNLSANRCIAVMNPFFWLYSGKFRMYDEKTGEPIVFDVPDIWPSFMRKGAAIVPESRLVNGLIHDRKEYTYTPYCLSLLETIYVNTLALRGNTRFIGYGDMSRVAASIFCTAIYDAENRDNVFENETFNKSAFNKNFEESTYTNLMHQGIDKMKQNARIDPFKFWGLCKIEAWRDIEENRYLLEYLLSREDMIRMHWNVNLFKTPDEMIDFFKVCLKRLEDRRAKASQ